MVSRKAAVEGRLWELSNDEFIEGGLEKSDSCGKVERLSINEISDVGLELKCSFETFKASFKNERLGEEGLKTTDTGDKLFSLDIF